MYVKQFVIFISVVRSYVRANMFHAGKAADIR